MSPGLGLGMWDDLQFDVPEDFDVEAYLGDFSQEGGLLWDAWDDTSLDFQF